jgi:hypothetical protein
VNIQKQVRIMTVLLVQVILCKMGSEAQAHHSFAMFDIVHEKTLVGAIREFQWTNPHTWVWIEVPSASGGTTEKWGIEGMSPNFLGRRGWSKDTLKPGDKVTVIIHPVKDGAKGGSFLRVTLADGKVLDMMGTGTLPLTTRWSYAAMSPLVSPLIYRGLNSWQDHSSDREVCGDARQGA